MASGGAYQGTIGINTGPNVHNISNPNIHQTNVGMFGGEGQQQEAPMEFPDLSDLFGNQNNMQGGYSGSQSSSSNSVFNYVPIFGEQGYGRMK